MKEEQLYFSKKNSYIKKIWRTNFNKQSTEEILKTFRFLAKKRFSTEILSCQYL